MIERYPTECTSCGHRNILRITLGTDIKQEHAFACAHCGDESRIELELDFINRRSFPEFEKAGLGAVSYPKVRVVALENSIPCENEGGTVTNLDPTFLVPGELLHKDKVFSWMYSMDQFKLRVKTPPASAKPDQKLRDIVSAIGVPRHHREILDTFLKAWDYHRRGRPEMSQSALDKLRQYTGPMVADISSGAYATALYFCGTDDRPQMKAILQEVNELKALNAGQCQRLHEWVNQPPYLDMIDRQIEVMKEFQRGYSQFSQAWIYAVTGTAPPEDMRPSTRDLHTVKMFYGTAFEHLSSGFALPAALNNIRAGRPFDQFQHMDMKKYLSIDKAGRGKSFEGNAKLAPLQAEFDSTIRNASHHGGFRIRAGTIDVIEYKTGDGGQWKTIGYADYLIRCNRIFMGLMKLFAMHYIVSGGFA